MDHTSSYIDDKYMPEGFTMRDPHNLQNSDVQQWLQHIIRRQIVEPKDAFRWSSILTSKTRIPSRYNMAVAPRNGTIPVPISEKARIKEGKTHPEMTASSAAPTPSPSGRSTPALFIPDLSPPASQTPAVSDEDDLGENNDDVPFVETAVVGKGQVKRKGKGKGKGTDKGKGKAKAKGKERENKTAMKKRNSQLTDTDGSPELSYSDDDDREFHFDSSESEVDQTPAAQRLSRLRKGLEGGLPDESEFPPLLVVKTPARQTTPPTYRRPPPLPASKHVSNRTPVAPPPFERTTSVLPIQLTTPVAVGLLRYQPSSPSPPTTAAASRESTLTPTSPDAPPIPGEQELTTISALPATDEMIQRAAIGQPPSWAGISNRRRHWWLEGALSEPDYLKCVRALDLKVRRGYYI